MLRRIAKGFTLVLSLGVFWGCTSVAEWNVKNQNTIRPKAAFELDCPAEKLEFSVLETYSGDEDSVAKSWGVKACNRRVIYTVVRGVGWVSESASQSEKKE